MMVARSGRRRVAALPLSVTFLERVILLRLTALCLLIANQPSSRISFRRNGDLLMKEFIVDDGSPA
jgi:hypothetical protein